MADPLDHLEPDSPVMTRWSLARRVLFRLAFAYLLLCTTTYALYFMPLPDWVVRPYLAFWDFLVPSVGHAVFQADTSVLPNGSGDTTYNYVQVFCFFLLALTATAIWTLLDRKRPHYVRLQEALHVYVRFALAFWMFAYGSVKVFPLQGGSLTLDRLLQPIGDSSLEGFFWSFLGASTAYKIFTGLAEMFGGFLLVFRRTALLGALVGVGVFIHVVVLNFCYDVPVKLFSSHLLALAVFLVLPDLRRLANLFVLGRPVEAAPVRPYAEKRWLRWARVALPLIFILVFAVAPLLQARERWQRLGQAPKRPLHGIWNVEEFILDGQERPLSITDGTRWQRVVFDQPQTLAILTGGSRERFLLEPNPGGLRLALAKIDDPRWSSVLTYRRIDPKTLAIEGNFDGHAVQAQLRRIDPPEFRLVGGGFRWIHEHTNSR
ncbi:MAG TPA: hypothetical protein VN851_09970 [Thermoanaerobaculia bacterium]|nr:hypothetical protein [Thermoanaerobaculia bacterium]